MAKVLLVEDDPLIYKMYDKAFRLAGYGVEIAVNGQEALAKLPQFQPDIILLDVLMPTMNGIELLDKLRAEPSTKNIPVIVLTNVSNQLIDDALFARSVKLTMLKSNKDPEQVIAWVESILHPGKQSAESLGLPPGSLHTSAQ
jgi:CheY-like chemotaxis protein